MRKLRIAQHISLDGIIQHSADDGDFPYGNWTAPYRTHEGRDAILAAYGSHFDLLLGRRTYDIWAAFWPQAPDSPMAQRLNAATKFVATHHAEDLAWGPAKGVGPDLLAGVRQLKVEDGPDLLVAGSSTLTSTMLKYDLTDELLLIVYPVLLGTGKPLFARQASARTLELVSTNTLTSGILINAYRPTGPLRNNQEEARAGGATGRMLQTDGHTGLSGGSAP